MTVLSILSVAAGIGVWHVIRGEGPPPGEEVEVSAADAPATKGPGLARPSQLATGTSTSGAELLGRLQGLGGDARAALLAETLDHFTQHPVRYDPRLAAFLVDLLADAQRCAAAWRLLVALGPRAAAQLAVALAPTNPTAVRVLAIQAYGAWLQRGERPADPGWLGLVQDPDRMVARRAWHVVVSGVPYSAELADWCVSRVTGDGLGWGSPEHALAAMGEAGIRRLFALLDERPADSLGSAVLHALRFVDAKSLEPFRDRLVGFVGAGTTEERAAALAVLTEMRGDASAAGPALESAWRSGDARLRRAVAYLLGYATARPPGAIDLLLEGLRSDDTNVSAESAWALGEMRARPEEVLPLLRSRLDDVGGDAEGLALGAYGAAALPYLRSALESGDDDVAYFAMLGVQKLQRAGATLAPRLLTFMKADEPDLVKRAAMTLAAIGAPEALPKIWSRVEDGALRPVDAALAFLLLGAPADELLVAKLGDRDHTTNGHALDVLLTYGARAAFALDALGPYLRSSNTKDRRRAVEVVSRILGNQAYTDASVTAPREVVRRVRDALAPLGEDPDPTIRAMATGGLKVAQRALAQNG